MGAGEGEAAAADSAAKRKDAGSVNTKATPSGAKRKMQDAVGNSPAGTKTIEGLFSVKRSKAAGSQSGASAAGSNTIGGLWSSVGGTPRRK